MFKRGIGIRDLYEAARGDNLYLIITRDSKKCKT